MINKILKDIDNEESYYVGTNGCLYQDLEKEELLTIKQEIERLTNELNACMIERNRFLDRIDKALELIYVNAYDTERKECIDDLWGSIEELVDILKGSDKE